MSLDAASQLEWNSGLVDLLQRALKEDVGSGDLTTMILVSRDLQGQGEFIAKQELVVCGLPVVSRVFALVDPEIRIDHFVGDGDRLKSGDILAKVSGRFASLLTAERTALNFLTHLSGIATLTSRFAALLAGTTAGIYDTRKTIPGLRHLEKYAVIVGGGRNHRIGLYDGILIKNNHLTACQGRIADAVGKSRLKAPPGVFIEVEVESLDQVREAVAARPDIIMLDNMNLETIRQAREMIPITIQVEVSGNVRLETVEQIAGCRVDRISAGALTHSAPAADISLHIFPDV
jgi:nicotinate-nucleotide pyrophosphorylase (carboxylating)